MDIIRKSFIEVVQGSISQTPKDSILPLKKGYLTKISLLEKQGTAREVFLLFDKAFLRIFCIQLLDDNNPNTETLEDIAKEIANLVVGMQKSLAQMKIDRDLIFLCQPMSAISY